MNRHPALLTAVLTLSSVAAASAPAPATGACKGRVIQHAMGRSCVPIKPQRVIVLDTGPLDTALSLGIKPIGSVTILGDSKFPDYFGTRTQGIADVGTISQPSLEKIAALKPDLILSAKLRHGTLYPQLSRIAPTVMTETVGVSWREDHLLWGNALGKGNQAKQLLSAYRKRAQAIGQQLPDRTVSIVRFVPGQIRIMHRASFIGTILDDAGLRRPAAQNVNDFAAYVSAERIPDMDADYLFYSYYGALKDTRQAEILNHPLWKRLNVVQAGRAVSVNDDVWMTGLGITAANKVLDDLKRLLNVKGR
ncbi:ABC transporter substrate-binding protein [Deinococcus enclensis]|uniref:Iron complex transport system substrate-binding protein n=1 Tax=Deinococcus enclensis TaxID=1049582 RepID=A0ABT9MFQ7_9DEIO|nr:iron-siderophore ABC transporter substrate-binding protein [Deinococcus enclensis]MDP9765385.1 iron complex transport system substrate-binding protein [Deinococcus enclensis]